MSLPPPPSTPYGGPHGGGIGGSPQWGSQQPAPAGGQFGGPPPWGPPPGQPQWGGPPAGPPPKGGKGKWILGGIIVALVVALAVTITVLVVRPDSDGPSATPTNGADSAFASANDTGPVNIITEDPTCDPWGKLSRTYADTVNGIDWANHDEATPASEWTPELREQYQIATDAMRQVADGAEKLVMLTPHRVVRELYEQLIAYANSFIAAVPSYEKEDDSLAVAVTNLSSGLSVICSAVTYDTAQIYAPLLPEQATPAETSIPQSDATNPTRFIKDPNPVCEKWDIMTTKFAETVEPWRAIDPKTPASEWTAEQKVAADAALPVMTAFADEAVQLGTESNNPTLEDFAVLSAQYWRAFVMALPDYRSADNYLSAAGTYLANVVLVGCESAQ